MSDPKAMKDFAWDIITEEVKGLGLYEVLDRDLEVLYIGAGPLQTMLEQHFPDGAFPLPGARYYRTFSSGGSLDIEERRRSLISDHVEILGTPPKYNRSLRS